MKHSVIILLIISLISLSACAADPYERRYEPDRTLVEVDAAGTSFSYEKALEDRPYEQMITAECDIHDFLNYSCYTLGKVAAKIGVECLRQNDTWVYYSIHKTVQGGLLYIFYDRTDLAPWGSLSVQDWYYVEGDHAYADFAHIQAGSTMEAVEKIDPAARLFHNEFLRSCEMDPTDISRSYESRHYLKDGVLTVSYQNTDDDPYDNREGRFVVSDLRWQPGFSWWQDQMLIDRSLLPGDSPAWWN